MVEREQKGVHVEYVVYMVYVTRTTAPSRTVKHPLGDEWRVGGREGKVGSPPLRSGFDLSILSQKGVASQRCEADT